MKRRIVIPYFRGGAGHLSNARAIEGAIRARLPDCDIELVDPAEAFSAVSLRRLYVDGWKRVLAMPYPLQRVSFLASDAFPGVAASVNARAIRTHAEACARYVDEKRPDLVLSTHWGATQLFLAARDRSAASFPVWSLYYEFCEALKLCFSDADRVFYISSAVGKGLEAIGHPRSRLTEIDLIAQPAMRKPLPGKAEARRALGIDPDRFTVMLSLGGEGIGRLFSYVDYYARHGSSAQLLVLTGRNAGLLARLDSYLEGRPGAARLVKAYGFLPDLITHLAAADVAAGKCGASFVSELVAARRPLLVMQLGAPNEAANRTYLAQRGFAWDVPRPVDFTELVESFASGDERFSRAVARMEGEASRCEGADQIADAAAALLARPPTALRA